MVGLSHPSVYKLIPTLHKLEAQAYKKMIDWKHGAGEGKKEKFYTNQTAKLKEFFLITIIQTKVKP